MPAPLQTRLRSCKAALTGLALLSVILFSIFRFLTRDSSSPTLALKDGSVWRLEHLSIGTNHQRWIGEPWQRPLATLPVALAEKIVRKPLYAKWRSSDTQLMLCFSLSGAISPQLRFTIESSNLSSGIYFLEPGGGFGFPIDSWPRHAPYFDCVWWADSSPPTRLGSLRVKNPSVSRPAWGPRSPMSEAKAGAVTVKLGSIHLSRHGNTRANLSIWEDGKPTDNYALHNGWIQDALGNKSLVVAESPPAHNVELSGTALWAPELGWMIRGDLVQRTGFKPHHVVTFTNVSLPSMTRGTNLLTGTSSFGALSLEIYTNPRPFRWEAQLKSDFNDHPGFILRSVSASNHFLQIVRVEGPGITLDGMRAYERGNNYAVFPLSFRQERGDVTCAASPIIPFTLVAVPTIE